MGAWLPRLSSRVSRLPRVVGVAAVLGVIAAAVLVGPSTVFAPSCSGPQELVFADGSAVPLCDPRVETYASDGQPGLAIRAALPGRGPYGAGSELAEFSLDVQGFRGSGGDAASASINVRPEPLSWLGSMWSVLDWRGPCRLEPGDGVLAVSCELEPDPEGAGRDRGRLAVRAEVPAPPDPRSDPAFRWLEVTYEVTGGHLASGTTLVALDANADDRWRVLSARLADGSLLVLVPGAEGAPQARFAFGAQQEGPAEPGYEAPGVGRDIEFATCAPDFGPEPYTGSMACTGGYRAPPSAPGAEVRLELSWRPAP